MENEFSLIVCTNDTLNGSPRLIGRRLSVGDVVSIVSNYGTLEEVMDDYELNVAQIREALQYCSSLRCKEDNPKVFCHNCVLRVDKEDSLDTLISPENISKVPEIIKYDDHIFLGSFNEFLGVRQGQEWWTVATNLLSKLNRKLFDGRTRS